MSNQEAASVRESLPVQEPSARRRILDATYSLVEERGMAQVSMTAIADKAGVSRQTVYNNFPDVETAMLGYVLDELDRTATRIEQTLSTLRDPENQIRSFVTELIRRFAQQDFQVSVQAAMSPAAVRAIEEATGPLRTMLEEILVEGVETGQFVSHIASERLATLLFQMTVGVGHLALSGANVDSLADDAATLIAASVSAP